MGKIICEFVRGSKLFGTFKEGVSDLDMGYVVTDDYDLSDCIHTEENGYENRIFCKEVNGVDCQYVRESDFIDMIKEHKIFALEAIFQESCLKYLKYFQLNKWKLRQEFSGVASNSWVKGKKKMTVEKDLDMRCGAKSIFHSIRIMMTACQIANNGKIDHYDCGILLYKDIMDDLDNGFQWEDFNKKYKPLWKHWHHEMVECCPKEIN